MNTKLKLWDEERKLNRQECIRWHNFAINYNMCDTSKKKV